MTDETKIHRKLRIAIEAQRIFRVNKHGMDFVALESIKQLQQIDKENEYFILVSPGEDHCLQETSNFKIIEIKCPTYPLWEQVALPHTIRKIKPDLLHCTSNTAPIFCETPLVITLHDIIFLEKRRGNNGSLYQNLGWYYRRLIVPRILSKCIQIITVSKFECNRIQEALHLDKKKIKAIYNGFSAHFHPIKDSFPITQKYLPEKEYIFFLGNTDPKKNTLRVLKAYSLYLEQSHKKLPLLIADIKKEIVEGLLKDQGLLHILSSLRFPGYIDNRDLPAIYSGAFLFLYPSLRESFGIPILEAMACGTPLITSNTSSMPEIAGEGATLIDPTNISALTDTILEFEKNETLYNKQSNYGLERVKIFSWRNTAQELLKTYQSLTKKDYFSNIR